MGLPLKRSQRWCIPGIRTSPSVFAPLVFTRRHSMRRRLLQCLSFDPLQSSSLLRRNPVSLFSTDFHRISSFPTEYPRERIGAYLRSVSVSEILLSQRTCDD